MMYINSHQLREVQLCQIGEKKKEWIFSMMGVDVGRLGLEPRDCVGPALGRRDCAGGSSPPSSPAVPPSTSLLPPPIVLVSVPIAGRAAFFFVTGPAAGPPSVAAVAGRGTRPALSALGVASSGCSCCLWRSTAHAALQPADLAEDPLHLPASRCLPPPDVGLSGTLRLSVVCRASPPCRTS